MVSSSASRRYKLRLAVAMGVYIVSLFAAEYLIARELVEGPLVWALALIPGLAVTGAFYAVAMLIIEQKDEFLRMLVVRQILVATGFALSIATVWGFLENFDLVPHVDSYWVGILWFLGFGIGGLINKRTMGAWGECG